MKKILTWILSIAMVLTMMPVMGAQAKDPVRVIKLDKDMTLTEPVMVEKLGKNVVLDLNGYKIEGDFDCQGLCIVDNGAGLTIKDSSPLGTGKITSKGTKAVSSLACVKNGSLTINGGTFENEKDDTLWLMDNRGGKLTVNGGYIKSKGRRAVVAHKGSNLTINGGTMTSVKKDKPSVFVEYAKAVINGGKIISENGNGVDCYSAVVDVNGGDIAGDRALMLKEKSKAVINGGHFVGRLYGVVVEKDADAKPVAGRFEAPVGAKALIVESDKYHFKKATDIIAPGSVMEPKQDAKLNKHGPFYYSEIEKSFTLRAKISSAKLSSGSYTYDGKVKTPGVVVKSGNRVLKNGRDYTVSYAKGRKNVGAYNVTVTGKGNYIGKVNMSFNINPKGTKIKKLYRGFKRFYVKWKKQRIQTTGYQIIYSRSKKFNKAKVKTVRSNRYKGTNIKRLKRYKRYYVKVRTYKTVSGKRFYSGWSKVRSVRTR